MKTINQASKHSGIDARLIRAVVRQIGGMEAARENFPDIRSHGIDSGFHGFIYYYQQDGSGTVDFFKRNRKAIVELVERMADDLGESPVGIVAKFRCVEISPATMRSIGRCLYGGRLTDDDTQVANALAWFAAEEVARAFEDD